MPTILSRSTISAATANRAVTLHCERAHGCLLVVRQTPLVDLPQRRVQEHLQWEVLVEAVVRAATVLVVVRANLLRARARAHLQLPQGVLRALLFLQFGVVQARTQQGERNRFVLQLRTLLLAKYADSCNSTTIKNEMIECINMCNLITQHFKSLYVNKDRKTCLELTSHKEQCTSPLQSTLQSNTYRWACA